jgi:hypothetical protein
MTIKVGDKIYVATTRKESVEMPCPVCYGNKEVELILGNGEHVWVDCKYCKHGLKGPTGRVIGSHIDTGYVLTEIVSRIDQTSTPDDIEIKYGAGGGGAWKMYPAERCFESFEEAQEYADKMAEVERARAKDREERPPKVKNHKSYTWHVGYEKTLIRDAKRTIELAEKAMRYYSSKAR